MKTSQGNSTGPRQLGSLPQDDPLVGRSVTGRAREFLESRASFKIGDVARLVGVKAHVLRYWEGEFSALRPMKTRGSHRMYRRRDVELALVIRRLVHDEGYTISGARKKVRTLLVKDGDVVDAGAGRELALRAELLALRGLLQSALDELDAVVEGTPEEPTTVTVHSALQVPHRVLRQTPTRGSGRS